MNPGPRHAAPNLDIGTTITSSSPPATAADAERIAFEHFGIRGTGRRLAGERDDNFCLRGADGPGHLLKIVHGGEDPQVTDLATSAMLHVARTAPEIPIQRVVRTREGEPVARVTLDDGQQRTARMTTYLEGRILHGVASTPALRRRLGAMLARLALALREFSHPGAAHALIWDLQHANRLWPLLGGLAEPLDRDLLVRCLRRFDAVVAPALPDLRAQTVHNDFHGDNVLVDEGGDEIVGVLDFGDMAHTALVNDVAVAAAYQLADGPDPMAPAVDVVAGYHEVNPLTRAELELLHDLIVTRMALRVVITEWRVTRFPQNRDYITRHTPTAWSQLQQLERLPREQVTVTLLHACGVE